MAQIGYALSSEEHAPNDLVQHTRRAEEVGFTFALISDHFHPWVSKQGHCPLVWSVLGAMAHVTQRIQIGTGVTCPIMRIHPAIIAQAAATVGAMMPGRFFLGVGTGENLNEHVLGDKWPEFDIRAEMLEEAIEVIRLLWQGGNQSFYGQYYTVENARLYTLPDPLPPIYVAAAGPKAAEMAGRVSEGLINTAPDAEIVQIFENGDSGHRPKYGQMSVCCAESEAQGRKIAHEYWPNAGLSGELSQELPTPAHFEQAVKTVREEDVAKSVICGNDPQKHLDMIQKYIDAGYDHIYVHQIGPDQEAFFRFYEREILPAMEPMRR
ncbi:MAG: TIGR03557 family F420-dependent LLM class oxidoreductase [Anaerolineae bacterium]|nr:TIGR03557 family F420-dependent LLM class oxidoreductase [Anaerolineae bacterium]